MALTQLEAAKAMTGEVKRQAVIETFAEQSDIIRTLPFLDIDGGSYSYAEEGTLPGVAFRNINGTYSESVGVLNPAVESLKIFGGDLDVDMALIAFNGAGVRSIHERMKIKQMASTYTLKFIKGDSTTTAAEFDGLQRRLTGAQKITAKDTSPTNGGDPLSLVKLDQLIDAVDEPTHLIMNKAMARRLSAAARATAVGGYLTYSIDDFGRRVQQYNNLPILIADRNGDANAALAFDEVGDGGATATATSIYCVSFAEGMLQGIQNGPIDVRDLQEQDSGPVLRTRVEWYCSVALLHGRAAARLYGISDAAVIA